MRQETGRKSKAGEITDSPFSSLNFTPPPNLLIINQLRAVISACLLLREPLLNQGLRNYLTVLRSYALTVF